MKRLVILAVTWPFAVWAWVNEPYCDCPGWPALVVLKGDTCTCGETRDTVPERVPDAA